MSQFNFIYAEEHLSHREKAVYIYLRDRANVSGVCWPDQDHRPRIGTFAADSPAGSGRSGAQAAH